MEDFLTLLLAGISVGAIYGLIAISLNLTFCTTKTMNFGQGSVMMLCAMRARYPWAMPGSTAWAPRGCYAPWIIAAACLSMYPTKAMTWNPASVSAYLS